MMKFCSHLALLLTFTTALPSCIFIIEPPEPEDPAIDVLPIPGEPFDCLSADEYRTAHVYFDTRIERSTYNLARDYAGFMNGVVYALGGAGIITTQAMLVRADERPAQTKMLAAWGCGLDTTYELRPMDVIQHYSNREVLDSSPLGCTTDSLISITDDLSNVITQYPPELPGTNGLSVFGPAPDLVLVVHLDSLARRSTFEDQTCGSAQRMADLDGDRLAWLTYAGENPRPDQVSHWFVSTPEEISRDDFVYRCRNLAGFPTKHLDVLEPSGLPFYTPLEQAIASTGSYTDRSEMCEMLSDPDLTVARLTVRWANHYGIPVTVEGILEWLSIQGGGDPGEDPIEVLPGD